jgi:hypothetical protein
MQVSLPGIKREFSKHAFEAGVPSLAADSLAKGAWAAQSSRIDDVASIAETVACASDGFTGMIHS